MLFTTKDLAFYADYKTPEAFLVDKRRYQLTIIPYRKTNGQQLFPLRAVVICLMLFRLKGWGVPMSCAADLLGRIDLDQLFETLDLLAAEKVENLIVTIPAHPNLDLEDTKTIHTDLATAQQTQTEIDVMHINLTDLVQQVLKGAF